MRASSPPRLSYSTRTNGYETSSLKLFSGLKTTVVVMSTSWRIGTMMLVLRY
jgi:hypothetical protein